MGSPVESNPRTLWIRLVSRVSAMVMGGRIPGRRMASILFPVPGLPTMITLCPPAAAISSARRARDCPLTSSKSGSLPRRSAMYSERLAAKEAEKKLYADDDEFDDTLDELEESGLDEFEFVDEDTGEVKVTKRSGAGESV